MVKIIIQEENGNKVPMVKEIDSLDAVFVAGIRKDHVSGDLDCVAEARSDDINLLAILTALAKSNVRWISSMSERAGIPKHVIYQRYISMLARETTNHFNKDEMTDAVAYMIGYVEQQLKNTCNVGDI